MNLQHLHPLILSGEAKEEQGKTAIDGVWERDKVSSNREFFFRMGTQKDGHVPSSIDICYTLYISTQYIPRVAFASVGPVHVVATSVSTGVWRRAFVDVQTFPGSVEFESRFTLTVESPVNVNAVAAAATSPFVAFLTVARLEASVVVIVSTIVVAGSIIVVTAAIVVAAAIVVTVVVSIVITVTTCVSWHFMFKGKVGEMNEKRMSTTVEIFFIVALRISDRETKHYGIH